MAGAFPELAPEEAAILAEIKAAIPREEKPAGVPDHYYPALRADPVGPAQTILRGIDRNRAEEHERGMPR